MEKPGLARAIPVGILGFLAGCLIVIGLRALQSMDPVWDPGVAIVLTPFTTLAAFIWGMGAFNPKMNQHAHPPGEHHDDAHDAAIVAAEGQELAEHDPHHAEEEDSSIFGILSSQIWAITTGVIIVVLIVAAVGTAPTGLFLRTVNQDVANVAAVEANQTFALPLGLGEFQASQLTVFIGFVAVTMISLLLIAGVIGFLFYAGHQGAAEVKDREPTPQERRPPWIVRKTGGALSGFARKLREGIPGFFGQR